MLNILQPREGCRSPADPGHEVDDWLRAGRLQGGSLEMSNVGLSQVFTILIVARGGFQANARIITASEDLTVHLRQPPLAPGDSFGAA
ncbi:flagellar basal body rod C-terminal domain-containing protein [Leifsonia sp. McL0607]|uniref:flagellar basal body rod C-terminal domain-containing protein n=1 Tax=Leifsonia sp. McL0607 TaxID=3415672 RepID=UPI003CE7E9E0